MEVLGHLGAEHPLVRHYTRGGLPALRPVRISDLVAMRDWYRSRTYRELFVLIGARHQLALPLCTGDGGVIAYAFNRSGADFGGSEVGLASWLQPTLAALHVAAIAARAPEDLIGAAWERAGPMPREYEVLTLLAEGMTARAIGRALCVSERTINRHVGHVYDKLGHATASVPSSMPAEPACCRDGQGPSRLPSGHLRLGLPWSVQPVHDVSTERSAVRVRCVARVAARWPRAAADPHRACNHVGGTRTCR
jgi:hypothetical protein